VPSGPAGGTGPLGPFSVSLCGAAAALPPCGTASDLTTARILDILRELAGAVLRGSASAGPVVSPGAGFR
jgi:hypothetical protein